MMGMASEQPGQGASIADVGFRKWQAFVAIAIGMFLSVAEQTGVAIALPEIAEDFDVNIPVVQWVDIGIRPKHQRGVYAPGQAGRHGRSAQGLYPGFRGVHRHGRSGGPVPDLLGAARCEGGAGGVLGGGASQRHGHNDRGLSQAGARPGHWAVHDDGRGGGHGRGRS